jgi:nucleoid DNA-binding protein
VHPTGSPGGLGSRRGDATRAPRAPARRRKNDRQTRGAASDRPVNDPIEQKKRTKRRVVRVSYWTGSLDVLVFQAAKTFWTRITARVPTKGTRYMATKKTKTAGPMTKSALLAALVDSSDGLSRKQVKAVMETLVEIGHKELKHQGVFTVPGFAKFTVIKKPATKARKGINPFTGEPTVFKAKPARKVVRARPVKAAKDAVA